MHEKSLIYESFQNNVLRKNVNAPILAKRLSSIGISRRLLCQEKQDFMLANMKNIYITTSTSRLPNFLKSEDFKRRIQLTSVLQN